VDKDKIIQGVRMILEGVGEDLDREGLQKTPERVAKMYEELLCGVDINPADVIKAMFMEEHEEMIVVKDIPFYSICEHHLIPFLGKAHVAYIPGPEGQITGISKLARVVDVLSNVCRCRRG